jgi:hypothetical protein
MAEIFNFEWAIKKFHNDDWGASPVGGNWSNLNSTFTGIFGKYLFFIALLNIVSKIFLTSFEIPIYS